MHSGLFSHVVSFWGSDSFELFPEGVQKVANVLPLTQGVKLLKSVSLDQPIGDPRFILFLLTVVTIIGFGLAVKLFRWE